MEAGMSLSRPQLRLADEWRTPVAIPRRRFLRLIAGAALLPALPALPRTASALDYPTRPVRIIVGAAAGSSPDVLARLMGQWLAERYGQQFVVEDRPGAASNMGTEVVVRAPADGYTLLLVPASAAINATLYDKLSFNFIHDIAPVAGIVRVPNIMVVNPSVPVTTVPEFIAYAKANPGKVNFGSTGIGSSIHMAGELFKMMTGIDMVHVPYRGTAIADLLAGRVQVAFDTPPNSLALIRAGSLRALAVTTATRSEILPDVPAVGEFVPGYEVTSWWGIGAPRDTPNGIVDGLNREIQAGLADPKIRERLTEIGGTALTGSAADFQRLVVVETEKWGKVIKFANIKPA
jgi:tripartite-type tricarboxylate transporter receptor subunit TctC